MYQSLNISITLSVIISLMRIICVKFVIYSFVLTCLHGYLQHVHLGVQIALYWNFCLCFYGIALRSFDSKSIYKCYNKCMKSFFGYHKYSSVTSTLLDVQLPSFDTVMSNSRISLTSRLRSSSNNTIKHVCLVLNVQ